MCTSTISTNMDKMDFIKCLFQCANKLYKKTRIYIVFLHNSNLCTTDELTGYFLLIFTYTQLHILLVVLVVVLVSTTRKCDPFQSNFYGF